MLGLATFDLDEYTYGALRAGAIGFQLKDAPQDQLLSAIRVIATGCPLTTPPWNPFGLPSRLCGESREPGAFRGFVEGLQRPTAQVVVEKGDCCPFDNPKLGFLKCVGRPVCRSEQPEQELRTVCAQEVRGGRR